MEQFFITMNRFFHQCRQRSQVSTAASSWQPGRLTKEAGWGDMGHKLSLIIINYYNTIILPIQV